MEVAWAVGGSFLSSFLQVLFDRMARPEFLNLFLKRKYESRILEKLKGKLLILQAVLEDAEKKQWQSQNSAVKEWLDGLQEVAYQVDDALDLINTEALRIKVESQYPTSTNQVSSFFHSLRGKGSFSKYIMPKLQKIIERLEDFEQEIGILGLVKHVEPKKQGFEISSTSLVDESDVFGRDADKESIIQDFLSDAENGENVSVISIVGLGGVGKTTLVQLVYNDERVKFDKKAWVCISEEYDAVRITRELLTELNIKLDSNETFDSLQVKLKEGLSRKRFLVVLDDVWNRNYMDWSALSTPMNGGEKGSKIIVTTRDETVALVMGSKNIYHLNRLSEEDCWSLFKKHAFPSRDVTENSEFELTGKEIVKKCGGLPLAVKAIAGLLRSKESIEEWNEILRSDEWAGTNNHAGILPSLRLSYTHLSSHLKRCFAYCAVFHKDYQFSKDEVILLWMANDLLESSRGNKRPEDIGSEFLHELRARSLLQKSSGGKFCMHDLVNDLAKYVCGKYFLRQEDQGGNHSLAAVHHFSYISSNSDVFERFKHLTMSKFLRTFLPLHFSGTGYKSQMLSPKLLRDVLFESKSLRVLSLRGYRITELPNFAKFKQLRFLDLSFTRIKRLPCWICTLFNLQTLLLVHCQHLSEFPEGMEKLINLRYLDISGVQLTKMPMDIGRLESLQFLSTFVGSKDSQIDVLDKLSNLHGEFTISGLENVASGKNASMAKMKEKKYIKKLTLKWDYADIGSPQVAEDILRFLEPHSNMKFLEIDGFCGTTFPSWLEDASSFSHMTSLSLSNCRSCSCLPGIGLLPSLKYLTISGLNEVREIGSKIYGYGCTAKPLPCLKELRITGMKELRKWHIPGNGVFSCLELLVIGDCPNLIGEIPKQLSSLKIFDVSRCPKLILEIPLQLPSLEELIIDNCQEFVNSDGGLTLFDFETNFSSLCKLEIREMSKLKKLSSDSLDKKLSGLEMLQIEECTEMVSLPFSSFPCKLKNLVIEAGSLELVEGETCHLSIEKLYIDRVAVFVKNLSLSLFPALLSLTLHEVSNVEELSIPTSLLSLSIWRCNNFMSFTVGGGLLAASNLTAMSFNHLPKLKSLPERMQALLPSLQFLELYNCPEIECFPDGGLPSTLQSLTIGYCERLWSSHREWGLHTLSSLTTLSFSGFIECLLLPSTVTTIDLSSFRNLRKLDHIFAQQLTSLQCLWVFNLPELRSLPKEGLPVSLSKLVIQNCPKIQSLPEKGLPSSLSILEILDCPLLKQHLECKRGKEWQKVAQIPCITVDYDFLP